MGLVFGSYGDDDSYNRSGASWSTSSETDSRFNMSGDASGLWSAEFEISKAVKAKEKELGVKAPDDLTIGVCKY